MSARPLRATHPHLAKKYAERVAKHAKCVVTGPGGPGLPTDVCEVASQKKGSTVYHVLLGTHRRTFLRDSDATRCEVSRTWQDTQTSSITVEFPVQRGSAFGKSADRTEWALTPVGCTCPDWLHRGTDSNEFGLEGLRSASIVHRYSIAKPEDRVMGALRGCKHMIAVKARLEQRRR